MTKPDLTNRTFHLALKVKDSFSDTLLLNFLVCSLAERGANIVIVTSEQSKEYLESVVPVWFKRFETGNNSLTFTTKDSLSQGIYFIHNYDEITDQLKTSKVVKINATNANHINVPFPDRPMDLVSGKVLQALVVA